MQEENPPSSTILISAIDHKSWKKLDDKRSLVSQTMEIYLLGK